MAILVVKITVRSEYQSKNGTKFIRITKLEKASMKSNETIPSDEFHQRTRQNLLEPLDLAIAWFLRRKNG
ncbi:hypothetical protein SF83666_b51010 (plasmid) [Sinorhizobium fredii CCBAU 83666]|nr:hypothetical protein SF83666_b51010 [Sinorhizobium fredii CCBAU 83666]